MAWKFYLDTAYDWAMELIYGPPPPPPKPKCEPNDYLCEWTDGQHFLRDVPDNILNVYRSPTLINAMSVGATVTSAELIGVPPLATLSAFWLYKLASMVFDPSWTTETRCLGLIYIAAQGAGYKTNCPTLALLTVCAMDLSYKAYTQPENCIGTAGNMLVGYLGFELGDQLTRLGVQGCNNVIRYLNNNNDNKKGCPVMTK